MEAFFQKMEAKIQKAVKADVKKILKEVGSERIYAAALVTDSDCITLFLAVNTYENMQRTDTRYIEILDLPDEQAQKIRAGIASVTKWVPDEWGYSDGNDGKLTKVSKLLFAKEASDSAEYAAHRKLFIDTVISAFKGVIESKAFGKRSEEIVYFVSMSDDEKIEELENYSAKQLNSAEVYEQFLKRYETGETI